MKKYLISIAILIFISFSQSVFSADVKVMRAINLIEKGEECMLIPEKDAWESGIGNKANATTLREMIKNGWKISYAKDLPTRINTEFIIIFTKE